MKNAAPILLQRSSYRYRYDKQSLRFYQTQTRLRKISNYIVIIIYHKNLVLSIFFKKYVYFNEKILINLCFARSFKCVCTKMHQRQWLCTKTVQPLNCIIFSSVVDPACGTSGFLVSAGEYLKENYKEEIFFNKQKKDHYMNSMFYGYDMDRTMLRIGAMNMMTHGIDSPFIEYRDSLSDQNTDREKYSLILANPPFKGSLDYDIVSADLLKMCKTKKTELLFLALFLRMLKTGGRCACIVPDGVLFGSSAAHKAIRKEIIENNRLEAVVSMPSGVFKPYAGVSTAVLIFTKTGHGGTDKVWFYDMKADGFSLDDKRTPTAENDIPDIIERFHNLDKEADRAKTEQSFLVDKQDIVDNNYDLSINKYKEVEYVPVEYPPTAEIIKELKDMEDEIQKGLAELEGMLDE